LPYLPPNYTYHDCINIDPTTVGNNILIVEIKDDAGNIVDVFVYNRIADTTVYCAEITTPATEGVYAMDYKILDNYGSLVAEMFDDYLVVSNTESSIALLQQILNWLKTRKA